MQYTDQNTLDLKVYVKKLFAEQTNNNSIDQRTIFDFNKIAVFYESLESLVILNLTELYNKSINQIESLYLNNSIGWVNRAEFIGRAIGSLIGAYYYTGSTKPAYLASWYLDRILKIDEKNGFPASIINLREKIAKEAQFDKGESIDDIFAGLPEILSMFHITKNQKYLDYANKIINLIPQKGFLKSVLNKSSISAIENRFTLNAFTSRFINLLSISNSIFPMHKIQAYLSNIKIDVLNKLEFGQYSSLIETYFLLTKYNITLSVENVEGNFRRWVDSICLLDENNELNVCQFDSNYFRVLLYKDIDFCDGIHPIKIIESFQKIDKLLKQPSIYSQIIIPSLFLSNRRIFNDNGRNHVLNQFGHFIHFD